MQRSIKETGQVRVRLAYRGFRNTYAESKTIRQIVDELQNFCRLQKRVYIYEKNLVSIPAHPYNNTSLYLIVIKSYSFLLSSSVN